MTQGAIAQRDVNVPEECKAIVNEIAREIVGACNFLLDSAEEFQAAADNEIITLQDLSVQQDSVIERQAKYISELKDYNDKWYKNPIYMGLIGIIAGGLAISTLER